MGSDAPQRIPTPPHGLVNAERPQGDRPLDRSEPRINLRALAEVNDSWTCAACGIQHMGVTAHLACLSAEVRRLRALLPREAP